MKLMSVYLFYVMKCMLLFSKTVRFVEIDVCVSMVVIGKASRSAVDRSTGGVFRTDSWLEKATEGIENDSPRRWIVGAVSTLYKNTFPAQICGSFGG